MKKFMVAGFVIVCLFILFPFPSYAIDNSDTPLACRPFKKFGRGMANVISSPLEIPHHMYLEARKGETWWEQFGKYFPGLFIGTGWTIWRLSAGAYDIATFLFPSYEFSLIQPEYFLGEFEKEYTYDKSKD